MTLSAMTTAPGSSFLRARWKEPLVVVLLRVQDDDVEDVVDPRDRLGRVSAFESLEYGAHAVVEHGRTLERGLDLPLNLGADEAARDVVVHDSACLHGGIDCRRPDEAKAGAFELLGQGVRLGCGCG